VSSEAANLAQVASAAIAALAILAGVIQWVLSQREARRTYQLQAELFRNEKEVKAIELLLQFFELRQQAGGDVPSDYDDPQYWRHNALVTITEAIHKLTRGDPEWTHTVDALLGLQHPFLARNPIASQTFDSEFLGLLAKHHIEARSAFGQTSSSNGTAA
jgi:hypothetical protein